MFIVLCGATFILFHQFDFHVNQAVKKTFKEFLYFVLWEADREARKLKSAYEPSGSLGRNYPGKRPGVFLLNPGRDAIPLRPAYVESSNLNFNQSFVERKKSLRISK